MSEANKALVRRCIEEIWNQGNFAAAGELLTAEIVRRDPNLPEAIKGREAYNQCVASYRTPFPEAAVIIDDLVAEGDTVVARWTGVSGPQKAAMSMPGAQFPPTGKGYTITGVSILGIRDGKIAEDLCWFDAMSFWKQLSLVTDPAVAEANKALIRRLFDEFLNKDNPEVVGQIIAPDSLHRINQTPEVRGSEGYKQHIAGARTGFPDIHFTLDDMVAEGDRITVRFKMTGTHTGDWAGIAPTGKRIAVTGTATCRIAGGKIVEELTDWDALGLFQQLGVVPALGMAKAQAAG